MVVALLMVLIVVVVVQAAAGAAVAPIGMAAAAAATGKEQEIKWESSAAHLLLRRCISLSLVEPPLCSLPQGRACVDEGLLHNRASHVRSRHRAA